MQGNWIYIGAFLEKPAGNNLLEFVKSHVEVPEDWKVYCDHMTIIYNDNSDNATEWRGYLEQMIGTTTYLTVTHIGVSERCIAVKVIGFPSNNANPHITVATAPGVRPVESNQIS